MILRVILQQLLQVTAILPERILVLAVLPGINAELQPLQISLEVVEFGLIPCLLPIFRISLAAEFNNSSSLSQGAWRIEDRWSIASEALAFLFEWFFLDPLGMRTTHFQECRFN